MMVQTTALWGEDKKAVAPKNAWVSSQNTTRVPFRRQERGSWCSAWKGGARSLAQRQPSAAVESCGET